MNGLKLTAVIASVTCLAIGVAAYTQLTLFVVQPIGAVPEGRTVIIARKANLNFIDSADGVCARLMGGVSLLCRGMAMSKVLGDTDILARLPYSETLYEISTDGTKYDR